MTRSSHIAVAGRAQVPAISRHLRLERFLRSLEPFAWIAPGLLVFVTFVHLPIALQLGLSVISAQVGHHVVIGLSNFVVLLRDADYWNALLNNVEYAVTTVIGKLGLSLALALALNGAWKGRSAFRAIFFLPVILSFVAIGTIWGFMYQDETGAIDQVLTALGLGALSQDWLGDPRFALWSIVLVDIWKWTGFHMVIYLAGLQAMNPELTDAAQVDGATAWQRLRFITIPLLRRYTTTNLVIATLGAFSVFDLVYVMTQGGPFGTTQVGMLQVYLQAFQFHHLGYASAQSTVLLVIIALVSFAIMRLTGREQPA